MSICEVSPQKCMGCYLCADVCGSHAIHMIQNREGFFYPQIDKAKCTECGACEKKCPALTENGVPLGKYSLSGVIPEAYAVKCTDDQIRFNSASGGVFPLLARNVLSEGGIVFGAAFTDAGKVSHRAIYRQDELVQLQSSKYAQSDMTGIYRQINQMLREGTKVLFSGTPCQAAALYNYLGKNLPDNLILVDLFCHGISSPGLLEQYLREITDSRPIHAISFRHKEHGWEKYNMHIEYGETVYSKSFQKDPFLAAFCTKSSLRESCYCCHAKGFPRHSDLTLGDFWMVDRVFPKMNDKKGVSIVLANTEKGEKILSEVFDLCEIRKIPESVFLDIYAKSGEPVARPSSRDHFFELAKQETVALASHQMCRQPVKAAVIRNVRMTMVKFGIYEQMRTLKKRIHKNGE